MPFLTRKKSTAAVMTPRRSQLDILIEQHPRYMQWVADVKAAKHPSAVIELGQSPDAPPDLKIHYVESNSRYRDAEKHLSLVNEAVACFWEILKNEDDLLRRHAEITSYIEDYAHAEFAHYLEEQLKLMYASLGILELQIGRKGPQQLREGDASLLMILIDLWKRGNITTHATNDERDAWVARYIESPTIDMFSDELLVNPDDALDLASDALNDQSLTKLQYVRALYNDGNANYKEKLGPAILEINNTIRRLQFQL
jgi:hypothetical protein